MRAEWRGSGGGALNPENTLFTFAADPVSLPGRFSCSWEKEQPCQRHEHERLESQNIRAGRALGDGPDQPCLADGEGQKKKKSSLADGPANSYTGKDVSPLSIAGSLLGSWVMGMTLGTML